MFAGEHIGRYPNPSVCRPDANYWWVLSTRGPAPPDPEALYVIRDPNISTRGCWRNPCGELVHEYPTAHPGDAHPGQQQVIDVIGPSNSVVSLFASLIHPSPPIELPIGDVWLDPNLVVEIGCGTGSLALAMAPHAGEIHAMDVSAEMVRIANDKKAAQRARNVTFHCGTLEEAPFDDGSFDAVWAFSILHLIEDRHAALRRCYALLKPGGVLIASNVCLGDSWIPYRPMIAVMRWLGKAPKVHFYDRCTIVTELEEAGFEGVEEVDVGADDLVAFTVAHKA